jgi:hypothetical protein
MRGFVPPDPQTDVSQVRFAVIYLPKRNRKRFPAGCVQIFETREAALEGADESRSLYPAQVLGPSKSSEGQYLYYLVDWLE